MKSKYFELREWCEDILDRCDSHFGALDCISVSCFSDVEDVLVFNGFYCDSIGEYFESAGEAADALFKLCKSCFFGERELCKAFTYSPFLQKAIVAEFSGEKVEVFTDFRVFLLEMHQLQEELLKNGFNLNVLRFFDDDLHGGDLLKCMDAEIARLEAEDIAKSCKPKSSKARKVAAL